MMKDQVQWLLRMFIYFTIVFITIIIHGSFAMDNNNNKKQALNFEHPQEINANSCIQTIIFTKDRAAQLHLLFRGMDKYYPEWQVNQVTILVAASTPEYRNGYMLLQRMRKNINFYWQQDGNADKESIQVSLKRIMRSSSCELLHLQCDDFFFINSVTNEEIIGRFVKYGHKLQSIVFSSHQDIKVGIYNIRHDAPKSVYNEGIWELRKSPHEWGFHGEMASAIWRRLDVLQIISSSKFSTPNWFEQVLHYYSVAYRKQFVDVNPEKEFRIYNAIVNPNSGEKNPIVIHTDMNSAKANDGVDIDATGEGNTFRSLHYNENISTHALNSNFIYNGIVPILNVDKCDLQYSFCHGSHAISFETLNPKENEIRLTLFRYHDTDDFDHEHETYRQNVFRVEYKNNDV